MSATEAIARFKADVGAAVTRAHRAAADAGARNDRFRDRNRELAEEAKSRQVRPGDRQPTSTDVRGAASGFRAEQGLVVEELPDGAELLAPKPETPPVEPVRPTTLGSAAVAGPSGQIPRVSDDDEDFSQGQILY